MLQALQKFESKFNWPVVEPQLAPIRNTSSTSYFCMRLVDPLSFLQKWAPMSGDDRINLLQLGLKFIGLLYTDMRQQDKLSKEAKVTLG